MSDLLNVDLALARILAQISRREAEPIALMDALGRALAEDITSPLDLPPFANSSMDGFAVRAADTADAPTTLAVVMDVPAGATPTGALAPGQAARIMTGAPLPDGADAVIPVEDTDAQWSQADAAPPPPRVTLNKTMRPGDNVRPVGENVRAGQVVLRAGRVLRPQDLGMLASIGVGRPMVTREPRVALLTTGDELVPVEAPLTPGKIHDANSYTLAGLVRSAGAIPIVLPPASDHLDAVRDLFREALALKPDMVVSSAGVSVGAADFVRTVLDELGEVDFWRINLRPGKPLAFGLLRATETPGAPVPFFGLPGNPVSAMVTFEVLVRPALRQMLGLPPQTPTVRAICAEDTTSDGRRSYLRVRLREEAGALRAYSTGTQSSGALSSLVEADGLMIVPEDVRFVAAGTAVEVITLS